MQSPPIAEAARPAVPHAPGTLRTLHPREGWPVCACSTPMHPDRVDHKGGMALERYGCPRRRWWNAWWHPHAWLQPRAGVADS
jgi:hypothetical protein